MKALDDNGDGVISFDEFSQLWVGGDPKVANRRASLQTRLIESLADQRGGWRSMGKPYITQTLGNPYITFLCRETLCRACYCSI
jgi:hypothetical protein